MESQEESIFKNKLFLIGLVLIPISFAIHIFLSYANTNHLIRIGDGQLFINYGIAVIYFIAMLIDNRSRKNADEPKYRFSTFICSLILFSISCFSVNLSIVIFSDFVIWVKISLILIHLALLSLCFNKYLPHWIKSLVFFILGGGVILIFYFTVFLLPLTLISIPAAIFFGLSLHVFVPIMLLLTIGVQFRKRNKTKSDRILFYSGMTLPLIVLIIFIVRWNAIQTTIHEVNASIITRPHNDLPTWVLLSQKLNNDYFTEIMLKGNLEFETSAATDFFGSGSRSRNSLGEIKKHNPLAVIGFQLFGSLDINEKDRIKILESKYDLRHNIKRKLWSGSNLATTNVLSDIQILPDYRLTYCEKIITIKNTNSMNWGRQEEALYTFHLPEGSVATSLSLWIDGKEEKSRLSTKNKADSAYVSIVGVERRDPSILHWQEGNTITVYVFPCTKKENRTFKIGVTSPMKLENNRLVIPNIYFVGPDASSARETSIIEVKSNDKFTVDLPSGFEEITPNKHQYTGKYRPYWEATCSVTKIGKNKFSFNGKSYSMEEYNPNMEKTDFEKIYLDINKSWSMKECETIWNETKNKKVYVYYDELYEVNEGNKTQLFSILTKLNFSLFPLHNIKDIEHSLLISKSPTNGPMLKDIENSEFTTKIRDYLSQRDDRINHFSLSKKLSPYYRTLKEFQLFDYQQGGLGLLKSIINSQNFINNTQDENTIILGISNTIIHRDTTNNLEKSNAPDHLLRLFAYNKIMQECGRNYFTKDNYIENQLIDIANEAYISSPISSMIVLESIKDYDRFGIDDNKNSLKNASKSSSGAVPEPHEWALIIMLLSTLLFLHYKRKNKEVKFQ